MVVTVSFDYEGKDNPYELLQKVFAYSLEKHGNDALHIRRPAPLDNYLTHRFQTSNNYKLGVWIETMKDLKRDVCFADVDMLCVGNISSIWDNEFDIAYTTRSTGANVPLNAGVMFIRYNERTLSFLEKWQEIDDKMKFDKKLRLNYAGRYCGQNQASFGFMLEKKQSMCHIGAVPCRTWNVCDEDWQDYPDDAKLIHCKSRLRDAILSRAPVDMWSAKLQKPLIEWYKTEREMNERKTV